MNSLPQYLVRKANFEADWQAIKSVRRQVFIIGQNVPADLEWAGDDDQFTHVLAVTSDGQAIGTGRMSQAGKIGRMAVIEEWRGQGVGSDLLKLLIQVARENELDCVKLSSQLDAIPFYERFEFTCVGDIFVEASIKHRWMTRKLY